MPGRCPEDCQHYSTVGQQQPVVIRCGLLTELLAGLASEATHVNSETCEACCLTFEPTRFDLNPVIASVLWNSCDVALNDHRSSADTELADTELADRLLNLRNFAESNLPIVLPDEEDLPQPTISDGDAVPYSAEDLRQLVPLPKWNGRTISKWAVGVTTAPRRLPTLQRCLQSLQSCGWEEVHLFVDGQVVIPDTFENLSATIHNPPAGAWRNYYLTVVELLRRYPHADAIMVVQDDALWPAHSPVREYLEAIHWPVEGRFIISPYCCKDYTAETPGWHVFDETWLYGAVAFIFSRQSAEDFIADPMVIERCRHDKAGGIDEVIGRWAQQRGIDVFFTTPSLVQHIGDVSTLWETSRAVGLRRATRFIGDEFCLKPAVTDSPRPVLAGWVSTDPPVLYHSMGSEDPGKHLSDEPMTRMAMYLWYHTTSEIIELDRKARDLRPNHVIHHMVNDITTWRELVAHGISAHFVNQNAFLDERLFDIESDASKHYDAVYNARMTDFKRHFLAADVPDLLIIGGTNTREDSDDYYRSAKAALPNARFIYDEDKSYLCEQEITALLNQARVGLCLSACEGTMFAATEYLLCGLPVVSTVSLGGRETWFDPRFTRIVPDDTLAVATAVKELIALNICPRQIRTETLSRMWEHRRRFLDLGQTIYAAADVGRDFARDFYARFSSKLGTWCMPNDIMRLRRRLMSDSIDT